MFMDEFGSLPSCPTAPAHPWLTDKDNLSPEQMHDLSLWIARQWMVVLSENNWSLELVEIDNDSDSSADSSATLEWGDGESL